MNNTIVYRAQRIYTGKEMLQQHAVVVNAAIITEIIPAANLPAATRVTDFSNALMAPAFIDLQLYGAYGQLLSARPTAATVQAIYEYSRTGGASHCMPTVGTSTYETIFACIDAVKAYWNSGGKGVLGLHVEGPWISVAKRGAHNPDWIFAPTTAQARELLNYGRDVIKMITLAPEVVQPEVIKLIQAAGIVVSAGHSNATYAQATAAFSSIKTATHLYNAMSGLQHREPGMAGAIMDHNEVCCSIVPDGYHVSFPAIRIAKKVMGERLFAITDAVTETGEGYYQHTADGDKYTSNGVLSGSALTMAKCVRNLYHNGGASLEEALRMCSLYPARVMQLSGEPGQIAVGQKANMVVLDEAFQVLQTICNY